MSAPDLLLVGLGNPGRAYAGNRHNIGFMAIDRIIEVFRLAGGRSRFSGEVSSGTIAGRSVMALKPMTYMNESGRAVGAACRFFKLPNEAVFVFHDEMDLAAGKVRVKQGGGNAGHRGLKSIDAHIGPNYHRIRLGVGHPGDKQQVIGHVLKDFAKADEAWLTPLLDAVAENMPMLLDGDPGGYMNRVALAVNPPKPKAEATGQPARKANEEADGGV